MTNQTQQNGASLGYQDEPSKQQTTWKPTVEIGRSTQRPRRFPGDEEFDPDLRGLRGVRKYDEMRRNDPDVGAILTAIEMSILSVEWTTQAGGDTPQDQEAEDFLESCMSDMSLSWSDYISDICSMFWPGWAYFEVVYKLRNGTTSEGSDAAPSQYNDGRIGWRKISIRPQESLLRWQEDDSGGLRGMWQQTLSRPAVFLPIEKCILFRVKRNRGDPEGISLLRNAYRPYYIKSNVEEIEVISAERDMTGIPYMRLPVGATKEDKDAALDVLEKLKWDDQAGLVLPRNGPEQHQWWEAGAITSPGAPRIDTDKVISRQTVAIARSVLAQFLTLTQGTRGGGYALSRDWRDLFHLAVKGHLDKIEETINLFQVQRLFALNDFQGLTKLPKIVHGRMGQRDIAAFADALSKLSMLGMPFTEDDWSFFRSELEMPQVPEASTSSPAPTQQPEDDERVGRERSVVVMY